MPFLEPSMVPPPPSSFLSMAAPSSSSIPFIPLPLPEVPQLCFSLDLASFTPNSSRLSHQPMTPPSSTISPGVPHCTPISRASPPPTHQNPVPTSKSSARAVLWAEQEVEPISNRGTRAGEKAPIPEGRWHGPANESRFLAAAPVRLPAFDPSGADGEGGGPPDMEATRYPLPDGWKGAVMLLMHPARPRRCRLPALLGHAVGDAAAYSFQLVPVTSREYCLGVDAAYGADSTVDSMYVHSQAQFGVDGSATVLVMQDDFGGETMNMNYEAAAPAYKAPRAP